jgi:hypothetical protein
MHLARLQYEKKLTLIKAGYFSKTFYHIEEIGKGKVAHVLF